MSPSQPANRDSRDCESTLTRTPGLRVDVPNQSISRNPGRGLSRDPGPDTLRVRVRVRHCVPVTRPRPPSRSDRDSHSDRLRLLLVLEVRIHVTRPGLAGKPLSGPAIIINQSSDLKFNGGRRRGAPDRADGSLSLNQPASESS